MLDPLSVLIIDADVGFVRSVAEQANGLDLRPTVAASVAQARARCAEADFDLILLEPALFDRSDWAWLSALAQQSGSRILWRTPPPAASTGPNALPIAFDAVLAAGSLADALSKARTELDAELLAAQRICPILIGDSAAGAKLRRRVARLRRAATPILLQGEPGSCKSSLARALHPAEAGHFFAPQGPLSSTAAIERRLRVLLRTSGAARSARHTLFLRALLELPLDLQDRLAEALEIATECAAERGALAPLGHRLIAAIDRDFEQSQRAGTICARLYQQLQRCRLEVPPLRKRSDDIPALADQLLEHLNRRHGTGRRFDPSAHARLQAWNWPGNFRELRQTVEHAYRAARRDTVRPQPGAAQAAATAAEAADRITFKVGTSLQEIERQVLLKTLAYFGNNRTQAARALGVSARTIYNRLQALQASRPAGRQPRRPKAGASSNARRSDQDES
jgi:DNA-binding NtrC family response regulator